MESSEGGIPQVKILGFEFVSDFVFRASNLKT